MSARDWSIGDFHVGLWSTADGHFWVVDCIDDELRPLPSTRRLAVFRSFERALFTANCIVALLCGGRDGLQNSWTWRFDSEVRS